MVRGKKQTSSNSKFYHDFRRLTDDLNLFPMLKNCLLLDPTVKKEQIFEDVLYGWPLTTVYDDLCSQYNSFTYQ